jgi:hypothetical protein
MQADLWAAFDMVYSLTTARSGPMTDDLRERIQYAQLLLPRIAMTMRGLALTRGEIAALPNTYFASATTLNLPDLLGEGTAWKEIRWLRERSHDRAASYRRATRVFVQLKELPRDEAAVLNGLRDGHGRAPQAIASVALLTQLLVVANDGSVMPSSITYEVQLRGDAARQGRSIVPQYELSRHLLLATPAGGGLVAFTSEAPSYLPSAGNDLGFATPPRLDGEPTQAPLERRCAACHGAGLEVGRLMTFSQTVVQQATPPVERLPIADNVHGHDVARRKMERDDYRALRARW